MLRAARTCRWRVPWLGGHQAAGPDHVRRGSLTRPKGEPGPERYYLRPDRIWRTARAAATKPKTASVPGSGTGAGCRVPTEPVPSITWAASSGFDFFARALGATFLGEGILRSFFKASSDC